MAIARVVQPPFAIVYRLITAAALTGGLLALSYAGLSVTTAPKILSLIVEPFSLLLMPGLLIALAVAGQHDFSSTVVLTASACFYFMFFFVAITRCTRAQHTSGSSR